MTELIRLLQSGTEPLPPTASKLSAGFTTVNGEQSQLNAQPSSSVDAAGDSESSPFQNLLDSQIQDQTHSPLSAQGSRVRHTAQPYEKTSHPALTTAVNVEAGADSLQVAALNYGPLLPHGTSDAELNAAMEGMELPTTGTALPASDTLSAFAPSVSAQSLARSNENEQSESFDSTTTLSSSVPGPEYRLASQENLPGSGPSTDALSALQIGPFQASESPAQSRPELAVAGPQLPPAWGNLEAPDNLNLLGQTVGDRLDASPATQKTLAIEDVSKSSVSAGSAAVELPYPVPVLPGSEAASAQSSAAEPQPIAIPGMVEQQTLGAEHSSSKATNADVALSTAAAQADQGPGQGQAANEASTGPNSGLTVANTSELQSSVVPSSAASGEVARIKGEILKVLEPAGDLALQSESEDSLFRGGQRAQPELSAASLAGQTQNMIQINSSNQPAEQVATLNSTPAQTSESSQSVTQQQSHGLNLNHGFSISEKASDAALVPGSEARTDSARIQIAFNRPGWGEELGRQMTLLVSNRLESAQIELDPPELGPLQVRIQIQNDAVSVQFSSQHSMVRDAVEQTIQRLQQMFSDEGLDLLDVNISDGDTSQKETAHHRSETDSETEDDAAITNPLHEEQIAVDDGSIDYFI